MPITHKIINQYKYEFKIKYDADHENIIRTTDSRPSTEYIKTVSIDVDWIWFFIQALSEQWYQIMWIRFSLNQISFILSNKDEINSDKVPQIDNKE